MLTKSRSWMRIPVTAILLTLATVSAGCESSRPLASGASTASATVPPAHASSAAPASSPVPGARRHPHVMILVDENHSQQQVIGNAQMPYLNSLASRYGLAMRWNDLSHPSLPNYLGLVSGSVQGNPQDTTPADRTYAGPTLVDQLARAGYSWKAYIEDAPRSCDLTDTYSPGNYDVNHNPFVYFDSIRRDHAQCNRVVPFTQFDTDLRDGTAPDFLWVSPNLINDMHNGNYSQGDDFLREQIPDVLASRWYRAGGIIIITFDEGETTEQVATIVISQHTQRGMRMTTPGSHYGTLRAIEETYGVPLLGSAAAPSSGDLRALF
jgi:phosphatidylinositol-3-phosphatase